MFQHNNLGSFDFAFVDTDKVNYQKYHEKLLQLVKAGGIIVYDNTLWFGTVAMPEESVEEAWKPNRHYVIEFNKFLAADTRIQISQVPLGDGITICRQLWSFYTSYEYFVERWNKTVYYVRRSRETLISSLLLCRVS